MYSKADSSKDVDKGCWGLKAEQGKYDGLWRYKYKDAFFSLQFSDLKGLISAVIDGFIMLSVESVIWWIYNVVTLNRDLAYSFLSIWHT